MRGHQRRRGFTLAELLIVIGIALLLIAMLLPAIDRAYRNGVRSRMAADLTVISSALEAYRADFDAYPQITAGQGAYWMCRALIGTPPATIDGADGLGFRARKNAKVWGPYLPPDRFKLGFPAGANAPPNDPNPLVIMDRSGKPILYFPAHKYSGQDISQPNQYAAASALAMFNFNDNASYWVDPFGPAMAARDFQFYLGDANIKGLYPATTPPRPAYTGEYILWGAGPDASFGRNNSSDANGAYLPPAQNNPSDDVTNWGRAE